MANFAEGARQVEHWVLRWKSGLRCVCGWPSFSAALSSLPFPTAHPTMSCPPCVRTEQQFVDVTRQVEQVRYQDVPCPVEHIRNVTVQQPVEVVVTQTQDVQVTVAVDRTVQVPVPQVVHKVCGGACGARMRMRGREGGRRERRVRHGRASFSLAMALLRCAACLALPLAQTVQQQVTYPVTKVVTRQVEKPYEVVVNEQVQVPYPVEQIVQRRVPVPVEQIVERCVQVPVERVIEKVIDVCTTRTVPQPVNVPVPVEKVVQRCGAA